MTNYKLRTDQVPCRNEDGNFALVSFRDTCPNPHLLDFCEACWKEVINTVTAENPFGTIVKDVVYVYNENKFELSLIEIMLSDRKL